MTLAAMSRTGAARPLGWGGVARIGLVQAALGAVVVLMTATLNRVMVVELHLAASVPGALIAFHYALQALRPRWGHGGDGGRRRTPWIVGGMALLGSGATLATVAAATMAERFASGLVLAIAGFALVGIGVGAAGTSLLTLLAERVAPERRPAAAAVVWITMIAGFVVSTIVGAVVLQRFSFARLEGLVAATGAVAVLLAWAGTWGLEPAVAISAHRVPRPPFAAALAAVWADAPARRVALFILVSMLAYSAQDLILEPFAGLVFGMGVGRTTALTSFQNGGALAGMIAVAVLGRRLGAGDPAGMRRIVVAGCFASAAALIAIAAAGSFVARPLIVPAVVGLGLANGVFAIAAVGLMMTLAGGEGAGVRMGVWGAAQAIGFGAGGFLGTVAVDAARLAIGAAVPAYALVFVVEAGGFIVAAALMTWTPARAAAMVPA